MPSEATAVTLRRVDLGDLEKRLKKLRAILTPPTHPAFVEPLETIDEALDVIAALRAQTDPAPIV